MEWWQTPWVAVVAGVLAGGFVAWLGTRVMVRRFITSLPLPDDEADRDYARRRLIDLGPPATDNPCGYRRAVLDHWTCVLAEHGPSLQHRNFEGRPFVTGIGHTDPAEPDDTDDYDGDGDDDEFEPGPTGVGDGGDNSGDHGRA